MEKYFFIFFPIEQPSAFMFIKGHAKAKRLYRYFESKNVPVEIVIAKEFYQPQQPIKRCNQPVKRSAFISPEELLNQRPATLQRYIETR